jgi:hypothetical protein
MSYQRLFDTEIQMVEMRLRSLERQRKLAATQAVALKNQISSLKVHLGNIHADRKIANVRQTWESMGDHLK